MKKNRYEPIEPETQSSNKLQLFFVEDNRQSIISIPKHKTLRQVKDKIDRAFGYGTGGSLFFKYKNGTRFINLDKTLEEQNVKNLSNVFML